MRFILAVPLLLVGCATKYVPPSEGPLATVELPIFEDTPLRTGSVWFGAKGQDGCGTMEYASEGRLRTASIRADRPTFFMVSRGVGNGGCEVVGEFTPRSTASYRIEFGVDASVCRARMLERREDGSWQPLEPRPAHVGKVNIKRVCDTPSKL